MIIATPLDLPRIEPDNWDTFWNIWNRESRNAVKVKRNTYVSVSPIGQDNLWTALEIYKNYDVRSAWDVPYYDISKELPKMHESILNLPFKHIHRVRILSSLQDINAHTDDAHDRWSVRALLHCEDTNPQWYFTSPGEDSNRTFFTLPNDTNWFAYNDKRCWHGSIFNKQYPKLLIQISMADLGTTIVNNSINKYKEYTIKL
jgi:hypothetical protein